MSVDQAQFDNLTKLVDTLLAMVGVSAPAIVPGALYTRTQIEQNLGIGNGTTTLWMDHGLKSYRPGTRSDLFLGSDVIAFVAENRELKRAGSYREKQEQRAKGRVK